MTEADYSQYQEGAVSQSSDKLAQIVNLAEQQRDLEVKLAKAESEVETLKVQLKQIAENALPQVMDELQLQEFSTKSGLKIVVKEKIRASISKGRNEEAIKWLDDHGFENLVKRQFIIVFSREDTPWANKFEGDLKKRKRQLNVDRKQDVHPSTLVSFVAERLTEGDTDFPVELFGVFRQRFTKIEVKG